MAHGWRLAVGARLAVGGDILGEAAADHRGLAHIGDGVVDLHPRQRPQVRDEHLRACACRFLFVVPSSP